MPQGVRVGRTIMLVSLVVTIFTIVAGIIVYRSAGGDLRSVAVPLTVILLVLSLGSCGLIAGPIIIVTKRREAREIDEILAGQNVLAHWTYAPDEWSRYIEKELVRARKYYFLVFVPIAVLLFALRSSLFGSNPAFSIPAVLIAISLLGFLLWVGHYGPILAARKRGQGDVHISPKGVLLNDRYYSWMGLGAGRSPNVSYEEGNPSIIQFEWTISAGTNRNIREVRVPVPRAHEHEVQNLLTYFKS